MTFVSTLTLASVGLVSKTFCRLGASVSVYGLENLTNALENEERNRGQGVVTVCNHISTLDDPVTWGVLPIRYYFKPRFSRWTLGASDILFTNPVFGAFFRKGQVLETFRGKGIYQPAVEDAIEKLDKGEWIHLFGEGKVNQPNTYVTDERGRGVLPRFKWGVGRILTSTKRQPTIIPMWITGFDKVMPEGRPFPYKYMPRFGASISVTFGEALPKDAVGSVLERTPSQVKRTREEGRLGGRVGELDLELEAASLELDVLARTEVTTMMHDAVESLGRSRSGESLRARSALRER